MAGGMALRGWSVPTSRPPMQMQLRCGVALAREISRTALRGSQLAAAAAFVGARSARLRPKTSVSMSIGPKPVWDGTGGPAIHGVTGGVPRLQKGKLHRVVWMCWTGNNPMPAHLQLCMQTVRRNSGLAPSHLSLSPRVDDGNRGQRPVILITPQNVVEYVPDPHPAYQFLHLAHRADYLR
ncbi:unnamed protein product, partial [Effrenium voratum]